MSSLLRSTKFVRYFTGAARTLILNSSKTTDANLLVNPKALCSANSIFLRDYATAKKSENLDPLIQKLDFEVRKYGRIAKKDIDEIFDEIKTKSDITSSQSLLVIRCCGELVPEELPEQRTLLVQKIWNVLTERGIPMDISHYNALLRVYLENEHPFSPAKFLEELETKGLQPNRVTYQRIMWRYCQEGDVEGATKVLEKMRELQLPVSEPVLNALVMGHAFHGDTEGAKAVLETMAGAGLQATNRTYSYLACGYAKKGDIEGINSVIKLATDKEVIMTDKDIFDIIEQLTVNGHKDKVEEIFPHLQKGYGYNQEACNVILRLLNKGHMDIAKKILFTMTKSKNIEDTQFKGNFFIKQLVKINKPADEILKMCLDLKEENLIPNAIPLALEAALQQAKTELALKLLPVYKSEGHEVRQHYYWPLLVQKGKENDEEGLMQIVREMSKNNTVPSGEALRDYVIPFMLKKDTIPQNIILKLQIANVPVAHSARSVIIELLKTNDIKKAAEIALHFQPRGQYNLISRSLFSAFSQTRDIDSFLTIVHVISSTYTNPNTEDDTVDEEHDVDNVPSHEIGRLIRNGVKILKEPDLCEKLLVKAHEKGLRIDTKAAEEIERYLGQNMTAKISDLLSQLTSKELEPIPLQKVRRENTPKSSEQLEKMLEQAINNGNKNYKMLQKQLITAYITENNVEKLHKLVEELKGSNFQITPITLAQIFECYAINDDVDKAYELLAYIKSVTQDFTLNRHKSVTMAHSLVKLGRYDEAIKFLIENKAVEDLVVNFQINSKCWQIVNMLAEQKDCQKVKEMIKVLIDYNYVEPSNVIFGPIIKANLLNDDLQGALNEFEYCCKHYRTTPWKGELMKALIIKEDATKLQWLADLSTEIHGEVNTLHDLVLAFVESGRYQQARRILETPGLQPRQMRLDIACRRYIEENQSEHLEGLLEVTKDISHIDRSNIFYSLLVTYCKANETDKALGLWTILQEDGEVPSDDFLVLLGNHLKSQNRPLPFVMPEEAKPKIPYVFKRESKNVAPPQPGPPKLTKKTVSEEIKNMIVAGNIDKATESTINYIQKGPMPRSSVMKELIKELAQNGNVEKIEAIGNIISEGKKREIRYNNQLTSAIFARGTGPQLLDGLNRAVQAANTADELTAALKSFPRGPALEHVIANPELEEICLNIVKVASSKGSFLPANLIWIEYLIKGKDEKAEEIFKTYLLNAEFVTFRRLLQESHIQKKPELIEKLLKVLQMNKNIKSVTFGNAYSRLINYYLVENQPEKAHDVLENALKSGVDITHINSDSLQKLKTDLEEKGVDFKYAV